MTVAATDGDARIALGGAPMSDQPDSLVRPDRASSAGDLTVEVYSPRVPESRKFTWPKSLTVGEAADQAAKAFDYEAGSPTFQNKDGKVLDREKSLVEAGIRDFDHLELTDRGGGV